MDIGNEIWEILYKVMHQEEYASIAENLRQSTYTLQELAQSFSEEQWKAFNDYKDAFMALHETMMAIALEKNK